MLYVIHFFLFSLLRLLKQFKKRECKDVDIPLYDPLGSFASYIPFIFLFIIYLAFDAYLNTPFLIVNMTTY